MVSLLTLSVLFKFVISSDDLYKNHLVNQYSSFIEEVENTFLTPFNINLFGVKGVQTWSRVERVDDEESAQKEKNIQQIKVVLFFNFIFTGTRIDHIFFWKQLI